MDLSSKYESRWHKFILSCDSFTAAYSIMLLLFYIPYVFASEQLIAAAMLPICCVLPFAVMLVVYSAVHRFNPMLFGRYHLVMPLSAFLAALFFVLFWSADSGASGACLVFFGAAVYSVTSITYRYCSFSVRVRLVGDSVSKPSMTAHGFAMFGALAALVTIYGFYTYDPATALMNAAYIVAAVGVILALAQYLASYYNIPKLGGKKQQPILSVFRALYTGLNKRTYASALLFLAAYFTLAVPVVWFTAVTADAVYMPIVAAAVMAAAFFISSRVVTVVIKRRSYIISIINVALPVVAAVLFIATAASGVSGAGHSAMLMISCIMIGAGSAIALRQTRIRFLTVKDKLTSGAVYILIELTMYAAAAIAASAAAIVNAVYSHTLDAVSFVYGFAIAAALAIAGAVTALMRPAQGAAATFEAGEDDVPEANDTQGVYQPAPDDQQSTTL